MRIKASEKVLQVALSQVGVDEEPHGSNKTPYTKWYGITGPWCAMFVSWVFFHAGMALPAIRTAKGFAYCPDIVNWAKTNKCWRPSGGDYKPKRGDIVLFDFIGRPSHVGIVLANLGNGRIQTVEGNTNAAGSRTGGSVVVHNRSATGSTIGFVDVEMVPEKLPVPKRVALDEGSKGDRVYYHEGCLNIVQRTNTERWSKLKVNGVFGEDDGWATLAFKIMHNEFLAKFSPKSPRLDQRTGRASIPTQNALDWWVRNLS